MVEDIKIHTLALQIDPGRPQGAQVYDLLREEIVKGRLPPGSALSENRLADELGVSRTPVRESLIKLAEDGLVRVVPQSGTFVSPVDLAAVLDSQLIRESLECATVFLAARNAGPDEAAELRRIVADQRARAEAGDYAGFVDLDDALHTYLITLSGRAGVLRAVQAAKLHLDRVRFLSEEEWPHIDEVIADHEMIIDRVIAGDARGARSAMRAHMRLVLDKVDQLAWSHKQMVSGDLPRHRRRRSRKVADAAK